MKNIFILTAVLSFLSSSALAVVIVKPTPQHRPIVKKIINHRVDPYKQGDPIVTSPEPRNPINH